MEFRSTCVALTQRQTRVNAEAGRHQPPTRPLLLEGAESSTGDLELGTLQPARA